MSSDARISHLPAPIEEPALKESLAGEVWSLNPRAGMNNTRTNPLPFLKDGIVPPLKLIGESQTTPLPPPNIDVPPPRYHRPNVLPPLPFRSYPSDPNTPYDRPNPFEGGSPDYNAPPPGKYYEHRDLPRSAPAFPKPDRIGNKIDGWWI